MGENEMINNKIRQLRQNKGLTLQGLSQALKERGVKLSASSLIKYERNERTPSLETWINLANFFGVPVSYIQGKETPNRLKSVLEQKQISFPKLSSILENDGYLITSNELKQYASGKLIPQPDTWILLSRVLHVPFNYLVGISNQQKELTPTLAPFIKTNKNDNKILFDAPVSQDELIKRIDAIKKSLPENEQLGYKVFSDNWSMVDEIGFRVPDYFKNAVDWYFLELCLSANFVDQTGHNVDLQAYQKIQQQQLSSGVPIDKPLSKKIKIDNSSNDVFAEELEANSESQKNSKTDDKSNKSNSKK